MLFRLLACDYFFLGQYGRRANVILLTLLRAGARAQPKVHSARLKFVPKPRRRCSASGSPPKSRPRTSRRVALSLLSQSRISTMYASLCMELQASRLREPTTLLLPKKTRKSRRLFAKSSWVPKECLLMYVCLKGCHLLLLS